MIAPTRNHNDISPILQIVSAVTIPLYRGRVHCVRRLDRQLPGIVAPTSGDGIPKAAPAAPILVRRGFDASGFIDRRRRLPRLECSDLRGSEEGHQHVWR